MRSGVRGWGWVAAALAVGMGLSSTANGQHLLPRAVPVRSMEPVVVTGTIGPTTLDRTTSQMTVLPSAEIAGRQAESVTDLLRHVPGLHIDQTGARGGISSVYIRGGDPNHALVMIDGVRVNDPTNSRGGSFDFSTLSTDHIERIEVVRGPLSAVYGSDAISGVINILTQRGTPDAIRSVEISGGRFGGVRALAQARGMLGGMDYALNSSYLDHGEPVEGSEFLSKAFIGSFGVPLSDTAQVRWLVRSADTRSAAFPDDSGGPDFALRREAETRDAEELNLGIRLTHRLFPWWRYGIDASVYDREESIISPGVAPGVRDPFGIPSSALKNDLRRYTLTVHHEFSPADPVRAVVGVEAIVEDGSSLGDLFFGGFPVSTAFEADRDVRALFAEVEIEPISDLRVQGGVRVDEPDGFSRESTPRVGMAYTVQPTGTTIRANWGEGFKLPSFFALGHPIVGNPGLTPEQSESVDVGVTQPLWGDRVTLQAVYFDRRVKDLVDFEAGPPPRLVNRSEVLADGVELGLRAVPVSALHISSHVTYVSTEIVGSDSLLRNRPSWRGGITVQWRPELPVLMSVSTLVVGKTFDSSIPTGDRFLDPYARVDLAVEWAATPVWRLFLAVDNLLDADYEEFVGFRSAGITPRAGVRATF